MTSQSAALADEMIACRRTPMEATDLIELALETDQITDLGLNVRFERDVKLIAVGLSPSLDLLVYNAGGLNRRGGVQDPERTTAP